MTELDALLQTVILEVTNAGIPASSRISPIVLISKRSVNTLGLCRKKRDGSFEIQIASRVLDAGEDMVKQILVHEVLHTCRGCQNHGALWKKYASIVEKLYGYKVTRTADLDEIGVEKAAPRYVVCCTQCGKRFERQRKSRLTEKPWLYHCSCGGKLKVISRPQEQK